MSRFEKKCFIGSTALHGLLLICFVFGSAFLSSHKQQVTLPPVVDFKSIATDKNVFSGGTPNPAPAAAQPPKAETPPAPTPPPQPEPPKPEPPKQVEKEQEPDPEPPKIKKTVEKPPETERIVPKHLATEKISKAAKTNAVKEIAKQSLNLKTVRITNNLAQIQKDQKALAEKRAADAKQKAEWNAYLDQRNRALGEVGKIAGTVVSTLGKDTVATVVGPGSAAYANYASLIIEHYKRAVYASNPQSDHDAEAVIKVVVARDGTVRSSQWVRRTSNSVLNKAVDGAMNKVKSLPSFPPEAKDAERTFNITIAFEAGRFSA